jgi:protocatechuate 3,4-dioxygenase, beta subunit
MGMSKISRYQALDERSHPPYASPRYISSVYRSPHHAPIPIRQTISELTGPGLSPHASRRDEADLTTNAGTGAPAIGERIIVGGRVLEEDGRPVSNTLVEVWQCNAAGRYNHVIDVHDAPLDPNFLGAGRVWTDDDGRYQFTTIRPGAYPWRNHYNAWRPAHIHFSLFGPAYASRLVTQMYFPGDPLLELDGIFMSVQNPEARQRLVARFDHATSRPHYALGYRFDIVLRGREETPLEGL